MEPREDPRLIPCRRLAAAVVAHAYHDLEFSRDHWRTAHRFLMVTLWDPDCIWGALVGHTLVEHSIKATVREIAERRQKEEPRGDPLD